MRLITLPHENEESGAVAVEYGILLALIAAVITAVLLTLGGVTGEMFGDTCTEFRNAVSATGNPPSNSC